MTCEQHDEPLQVTDIALLEECLSPTESIAELDACGMRCPFVVKCYQDNCEKRKEHNVCHKT
jgi:hypothetical protein